MADALPGEVEIVDVRTGGDAGAAVGDKSRWVDGLERALLDGSIDLAVHSAKDVPAELPDALELRGVPAREDPRDALVGAPSIQSLAAGARVGTTSLRRRAALLAARDDLEIVELRGNVDTRLRKLAEAEVDALVLALAGLRRLGREDAADAVLDPDVMLPAAGQGALALEGRADDGDAYAAAASISDLDATVCVIAERALTASLDATCHTPVAALATTDGDALTLRAFAALPDGSEWMRDTATGPADDPEALGRDVADRLRSIGAAELLARA
ncbi:MAG: hydroxymethylbilane synthase [Solirubrobacteraceae bacterium]